MHIRVHGDVPDVLWAAADVTGCSLLSIGGDPRVEVIQNGHVVFELIDSRSFHEWVDILNRIRFSL